MKTESIISISESPFWISETLPYFFEGFGKEKININYMYLILPFLLTKSIRNGILINANTLSTFDSLFYNPSSKPKKENQLLETFNESVMNKTSLAIIEKKFFQYESLISKSILLAYNKGYLKIKNGQIIVLKTYDYAKVKNTEDFLFDYFKCSRNLGIVFSKETPSSLYRKCKITNL